MNVNFVIYSEERLLMEQKLDELKKQYHITSEDMNQATYYPSDTPMNQILEDAMTPPFLSEYKMVIIKEPLFLTTSKQKETSDEEIAMFMDYISHDNPTTVLVVYHDVHNFDERKKVVKSLRQNAKFFEIEKVGFHQLFKTTRQAILARGATIDDDALNLLLNRTGDDLYIIANQVEKLCLYSKTITKEDVNRLVSIPVEENVFELTNAILAHDMGKAMSIYQDLMITNHEPIALIALISTSLRNLYQVKLLERKGYSDKEMVKVLGINPRAIYPIRKNAQAFELSELIEKLNALSELDIKIKTGVIDKKKGLELFLIRL